MKGTVKTIEETVKGTVEKTTGEAVRQTSELKKEIRKTILARRDAMDPKTRAQASRMLADRIIGHQWFYRADAILCFVSFGSEIDTRELLEEAWRKEKKVYVPKVMQGNMEFYQVFSGNDLQEGYRRILEPDGRGNRYSYTPKERVLMLMPGVAFDSCRRRLGYGGGYYDRYLANQGELRNYTIGIGFACQRVEELPEEELDVRPYQVILQEV